jgi:hypothetical protein
VLDLALYGPPLIPKNGLSGYKSNKLINHIKIRLKLLILIPLLKKFHTIKNTIATAKYN